MPLKNLAKVILYAYAQNQADEEREDEDLQAPLAHVQYDYPPITPESIMADILGKRLAAHCAEFCQAYGDYTQMVQFYRSKTARHIPHSSVDHFLINQDHTGLLRSFQVNVDDARAYVECWNAGEPHEDHLSSLLSLCASKMRRAANAIVDYYLSLSAPAATVLRNCASQHLELICELSGRQINGARLGNFKQG